MKLDKITSYQYATLTFFLLNSFSMNVGYYTLTNQTGNDCIFSILLGGILILILASLIFYLHEKYPDGIIETLRKKFPIFLQILFYPCFFLLIAASSIYSFSLLISFLHYYVLKEVGLLTISFSLMITVLYIVKKGIKTISKISEIFFYFSIFIFFFGAIGLIKYLNLSNLKPLLTTTIQKNISSSLTYFLSSIIPFFLLFSIPKKEMEPTKNFKKLPYLLTLLSIILTFIQLVIILSVLGIHLTNIYQNPDMIIYKKISFLNILERVEVFLAFNNILNSLFIIILGIHFMNQMINSLLKKKKEHISLALIGLFFIMVTTLFTFPLSLYLKTSILIFLLFGIFILCCLKYKYNHH